MTADMTSAAFRSLILTTTHRAPAPQAGQHAAHAYVRNCHSGSVVVGAGKAFSDAVIDASVALHDVERRHADGARHRDEEEDDEQLWVSGAALGSK